MENIKFKIVIILVFTIFHCHDVSSVDLSLEDQYRSKIASDIAKFEGVFSSGPIPFYLFQYKNNSITEYRWSVASAENPQEGRVVFITNNTDELEVNVIVLNRDEDRMRDGKFNTKKTFVVLAKIRDGKNAYFGLVAYIRDKDGNSIEYDVWEPKRLYDSKAFVLGLESCSSSIFTPCKKKLSQLPHIVVDYAPDPSTLYKKPDPRTHGYFFDMEDSTEERMLIGRTIAYVAAHRDADAEDDFELELEQELPDNPADESGSEMNKESRMALQAIQAKLANRQGGGQSNRGAQGGNGVQSGRGLFFNASAKLNFGGQGSWNGQGNGQGAWNGQGQSNGQGQGSWNGQGAGAYQGQGNAGGGFHLRIGGNANFKGGANAQGNFNGQGQKDGGDLGEGGGDGNMVGGSNAAATTGEDYQNQPDEGEANGEGGSEGGSANAAGGSAASRKGKGQANVGAGGGGRKPRGRGKGIRGGIKFKAGFNGGAGIGGGGGYGGVANAGSPKQNQGPAFGLFGKLGGGSSMFGDSNYNTVIDNYYKEQQNKAQGGGAGGFKLKAGIKFGLGIGGKAKFGGSGNGNYGFNGNGNTGAAGNGNGWANGNAGGNVDYNIGNGDGANAQYDTGNQQEGNANGEAGNSQDGGDATSRKGSGNGGGSDKVDIQLQNGGTSKVGGTSVMNIKIKTKITKKVKITKKKRKKSKKPKTNTQEEEPDTATESSSDTDTTETESSDATEDPSVSTTEAPSEPEAQAGGSATGESKGIGRKRSITGIERFINSKTSEVDLFSHMGWHTMGILINDLATFSVADEREIFMGFGHCPYQGESENDYKRLPTMKLEEQIKFYLTPLKMQCDEKLVGNIADLVNNVESLIMGKSSGGYKMFEMNPQVNLTKKEQLSTDERRQLYLSYAFSWFSKIYIEQLEGNPTKVAYFTLADLLKDRVQAGILPKSPYCVFRLYLAGQMLNDFLNSTHAVILTRHLMLVMKSTLIKSIQDLARIKFCEECDDAEKVFLKNDVVSLIGFLEFVYRNFENLKASTGLEITQEFRHFMKKELQGKGTGRLIKVVNDYIGEL